MRMTYEGGFFDLLRPFALLAGLVSRRDAADARRGVASRSRPTTSIAERAERALRIAASAFVALYVVAGIWLAFGVTGFAIDRGHRDAPSNPLLKQVVVRRPLVA